MEENNSINQNLLGRLEVISSAASICKLNFGNLTDVKDDIEEVSAFLGITPDQAVLFACLAELSIQRVVSFETLSKHLKCSVLKLVTLMNEIEVLEKKGYLQKYFRKKGRKRCYNDISFSVPHYVIEAIRKADASLLVTAIKFDLPGFLKQVADIIDEREENTLTTAQVMAETEFLITNNSDLPYVTFINNAVSDTISKCTLFAVSYCRLKGQNFINIGNFANTIFDDLSEQLDYSQMICSGNHELIRKNLLKIANSEFDGEKSVSLTPGVTKMLYRSYPALLIPESENTGFISHRKLTRKDLFFNKGVSEQIKSLEEVLTPLKFTVYRKALKRNKLSTGITAIFYGAPGTGKTESAYQIARKTGRNIMMVDLSQTKSKWFGESEKQVKKIFDDYNILLKDKETEPILFINEADGLFTRRSLMNGNTTAADHAINTIQNILLQALENFEGILIATTNLTDNLDKAFERRFTFRINFPKPDSSVRMSIWKNKLPDLSEEEAGMLGERFDITGSEIEVQVRQVLLKKVLDKKANLYNLLVESCSKDHGFTGRKKIGF